MHAYHSTKPSLPNHEQNLFNAATLTTILMMIMHPVQIRTKLMNKPIESLLEYVSFMPSFHRVGT